MSRETAPQSTDDGNLPACGCGWLLPTDMMVRTPKPEAGDDPVVVVLYCPRCETCFEREMAMGIQIETDRPVSEGVDGLNETGGTLDDLEAELWAEVFKNCCAEAASFEAAESWADGAVIAYRRRVGTARGV